MDAPKDSGLPNIPRIAVARIRAAALGVLFAALLAACGCTPTREYVHNGFKVGPNYRKPAAPIEDQWIDFRQDPRVSQDEVDLSAWWYVFNDQRLTGLVETAARQNLTLRVAATRILQAQAVRDFAVGTIFPQTQTHVGAYTHTQVSRNLAANAPPRFINDQWRTGFNLAWELDFWGKYRRAIESADASLDSTVEGYDSVMVMLVSDVATAYVQIRTLQERIRLAKENVRLQRESLKIAEAQVDAGVADPSDMLQTRNNVEQTESTIPNLEAQLRQQNNALCILLGIPPRDLLPELGSGPIPITSTNVALGIPAELVMRRPDVRQQERLMAAQCAQIGIAEAEFYPHISVNGVIEFQARTLDDLFQSKSLAGSVGPAFSWNIFNYGRIKSLVRQQQAQFENTVYTYQNVVLTAQREVEDGVVGFLKAQEQTAKLKLAVRDINEIANIFLIQAKAGTKNYNQVFVIQASQTTQQDSAATAESNIALNLIKVYRALGGGWQIRLYPPDGAFCEIVKPAPDAARPEAIQPAVPIPLPKVGEPDNKPVDKPTMPMPHNLPEKASDK